MICDLSDFRLAIAAQMGFAVCNIKSECFIEKTMAYFGVAPALTGETADVDIFVDAAGSETILDLYMQTGKIESRFVSVAVNHAVRQLDLLHLTLSLIHISCHPPPCRYPTQQLRLRCLW